MLPPFPCFLSGGDAHFRCPTLGAGAVLPPLYGGGSVCKGELQKIVVAGCNRRYFAHAPHLSGSLHQLFLRDRFGRAVGFAVRIVGGADPDRPCGGGLAAVVLAAVGTGDPPRKEGCFLRFAWSILFFSPLDFRLDGVKGFQRNDGFVGVRYVVAGQFPVVFSGNFRQVVFPEFCLEKKIPGVSVVAENGHLSH